MKIGEIDIGFGYSVDIDDMVLHIQGKQEDNMVHNYNFDIKKISNGWLLEYTSGSLLYSKYYENLDNLLKEIEKYITDCEEL